MLNVKHKAARGELGHSQAEKAESRERILDAAARQIREGGPESVSIAELMKAANLTHGGFYGHFPSRAALIAAAVERALDHGDASFRAAATSKGRSTVKSFLNRYLSPAHRDDIGGGCAIAALAGDVGRIEDDDVRDRMAERLEKSFQRMAEAMGNGAGADDAAITAWCTMVGGLVLARVLNGTEQSDRVLRVARQSILDLEASVRDGG